MYNHEPENYECPMCQRVEGSGNKYAAPTDIVRENSDVMAFISPKWIGANEGHVIVIPKRHVENLYDIANDELFAVYATAKKVAVAMKKAYVCDGVSTRQHNEPAGNQDVWHYHVHVFPRYSGDNLYLSHKEQKWVEDPNERKKFADKLKKYL